MRAMLQFLRLPFLLTLIFFIGRLVMGATGASYAAANSVFSMVILESHLAFLWGALARRYGYGIVGALEAGLLVGLFAQVLIFGGTIVSDLTGIATYFNNPLAIAGSPEPIGFGDAVVARAVGLVGNCAFSAVLAALGWALGVLIPERKTESREA